MGGCRRKNEGGWSCGEIILCKELDERGRSAMRKELRVYVGHVVCGINEIIKWRLEGQEAGTYEDIWTA